MKATAWERRTEYPLAVAAVLFLVAFALPILDTDLATWEVHLCHVLEWGIWALFVIDYFVRLWLATDRAYFLRHHLLDLFVVALPVLRPLRLFRAVIVMRVLSRTAVHTVRGRVLLNVLGAIVMLVLVASLAELDAERSHPGANIVTFPDALWWSITTVATVGYGDRFPVTDEGRLIAVGLMLCGIALVGTITASLASWLIERIRASEEETQADVAALTEEVRALRGQLERIVGTPVDTAGLGRASARATNGGASERPSAGAGPRRTSDLS